MFARSPVSAIFRHLSGAVAEATRLNSSLRQPAAGREKQLAEKQVCEIKSLETTRTDGQNCVLLHWILLRVSSCCATGSQTATMVGAASSTTSSRTPHLLDPYFLQQMQLQELLGQSGLLKPLQTSQAPPSLSEIRAKV